MTLDIARAAELAVELMGAGVAVGEVSATRNLRWANSALTTNGDTVDQSLSLAAFVQTSGGTASGVAAGQVRSEDDVRELVAKAQASAHAAGPAPDAGQLVTGPQHADFAAAADTGSSDGISVIAPALRDAMTHKELDYFGYAEESVDTYFVATSAGTRLRYTDRSARFELCAKSSTREQSAWSGQGGSLLTGVDVERHAAAVRTGVTHQLSIVDVAPGQHRVTLTSSAFADLMIYLLWSSAAREAHEGRSVFSNPLGGTRIGERLTSRALSLATDPDAPNMTTPGIVVNVGSSSMSSAFDTGLPIPRADIITDGTLTALPSSRFAAREANLPFTPLADNILVSDASGAGDAEELAARMGDGLLITCLWYIREVDPQSLLLTGLTRDGVYVVRGGEIVGAAPNFRFNESPVSLLNRITDAGASTACLPREWADWFPRAQVCPVTVDGFNLSTRSDAV
jgi:predicted Zn-dependent protease